MRVSQNNLDSSGARNSREILREYPAHFDGLNNLESFELHDEPHHPEPGWRGFRGFFGTLPIGGISQTILAIFSLGAAPGAKFGEQITNKIRKLGRTAGAAGADFAESSGDRKLRENREFLRSG